MYIHVYDTSPCFLHCRCASGRHILNRIIFPFLCCTYVMHLELSKHIILPMIFLFLLYVISLSGWLQDAICHHQFSQIFHILANLSNLAEYNNQPCVRISLIILSSHDTCTFLDPFDFFLISHEEILDVGLLQNWKIFPNRLPNIHQLRDFLVFDIIGRSLPF